MTKLELVLVVVVVALVAATGLFARANSGNVALAAYHDSVADAALDSVVALRARWVADSTALELQREQAQATRDTAEATIADLRARISDEVETVGDLAGRIRAQVDSATRVLVDSLEVVALGAVALAVDSVSAEKDMIIDAQDRLQARTDSLLAVAVAQVGAGERESAALRSANAALQAEVSRLNRRGWVYKVVAVAEAGGLVWALTRSR